MTDGQTYYDGLIAQGYPADQALGYTQQYYPGFTPAVAAPAPMPVAAPAPIPQPMAQPMVQPMAQPMAQPMMGIDPMGAAPMGMAPMAMAPAGEKKPIMAWAAVGCIVVALLLTSIGLFGNSWLVVSDENTEQGSGEVSLGLSNMVVDCSGEIQEQDCIDFAYVLLADDMEKAAAEGAPKDPVVKGAIENQCENIYSITIQLAGDDQTVRSEAGDDRENCLSNDSAGNLTSIILWIGIIGVLTSAVMLTVSLLGKQLPANTQKYGRISSFVSGGIIIVGAIIWLMMKYDFEGNLESGSSFYTVIFAGVLAIIAGVLDILDKR